MKFKVGDKVFVNNIVYDIEFSNRYLNKKGIVKELYQDKSYGMFYGIYIKEYEDIIILSEKELDFCND